MRRWLALGVLVALAAGMTARVASADLEAVFSRATEVLGGVDNYTATFRKQERVEGKLLPEETIAFKFKKPFMVYLRWIEAPHKGRETLYVKGANENRLKAHEGGLLGVVTVNLDPQGARAMKGNRHPITDSGLGHLVTMLATNVALGNANGELAVRELGEETVYGRRTRKWEGTFPKDKAADGTYYCWRALVNVDVALEVPIKVEIFDASEQLVERYGYEHLRLNAGLTDADFDPGNKAYGF